MLPNIHIYSKNHFLDEILQQKNTNYNINKYNSYAEPNLILRGAQQNIVLIDCLSYSEKVQELLDRLYTICNIILIFHKESDLSLSIEHKNIHLLASPINYKQLFSLLDANHFLVYAISENLILNRKLKMLVKIKSDQMFNIALTEKEFALIDYLLNQKVEKKRDEILGEVFGYSNLANTYTLETHIYRLRQKIGNDIKVIANTKEGYKILIN